MESISHYFNRKFISPFIIGILLFWLVMVLSAVSFKRTESLNELLEISNISSGIFTNSLSDGNLGLISDYSYFLERNKSLRYLKISLNSGGDEFYKFGRKGGAFDVCTLNSDSPILKFEMCLSYISSTDIIIGLCFILALAVLMYAVFYYQLKKIQTFVNYISSQIRFFFESSRLHQETTSLLELENIRNLILDQKKELIVRAQELANANVARKIAHDIKSPLLLMRTILESKNSGDIDLENLRLSCEKILLTSEEILDQTRSSLNLPKKVRLDLNEFLRESITLKMAETGFSNIILDLSECNIDLWVNKNELSSLISNILNNSISFSNHTNSIYVKVTQNSSSAVVTIRDEGRGFSSKILDGELKSTKITGNGIGLQYAFEFADQNNGSLKLYNHPSGGAVVELTINNIIKKNDPLILLDDDKYVILNWQTEALKAGIKIICFSDISSFEKYLSETDKNAEIFVDYHLGKRTTDDLIQRLIERRFERINIQTNLSDLSPFIKFSGRINNVTSKKFPY